MKKEKVVYVAYSGCLVSNSTPSSSVDAIATEDIKKGNLCKFKFVKNKKFMYNKLWKILK